MRSNHTLKNYAGNALYNLAYYSNSYETPKWTYPLPWCVGNLDEQPEAEPWPWGDFVSVLMQNISSLANGDHPFKRFSAKNTTLNLANPSSVGGGTDVSALLHASIVQNCSFWDSLGIGFVADPGKKAAGGQGPPSVADSSFVTLWLLDSMQDAPERDQAFVGYDSISSFELEYAVSRITADAVYMQPVCWTSKLHKSLQ